MVIDNPVAAIDKVDALGPEAEAVLREVSSNVVTMLAARLAS